jgi:ribosomal protein L37AE/L43A
MDGTPHWWLLLEKSDQTRVSKGIDGYGDETGRTYQFDSLVGNHKRIKPGDRVVIRKEKHIIGSGVIDSISVCEATKTHRRCPHCRSTDIRERKRLAPQWKCGKCKAEFVAPTTTEDAVQSFVASIHEFQEFAAPPTVPDVKSCAIGGGGESSQLSMIQLDIGRLMTLLGRDLIPPGPEAGGGRRASSGGQGFGLSAEQRRAVELRAMQLTRGLYERDGWSLKDTSSVSPYDFYAEKGAERRFIEVKGTTGAGDSVMLTASEVQHAREHQQETALVIVSDVRVEAVDGEWHADAGHIACHCYPWTPEDNRLSPTEYRYDVRDKHHC